MKATAFGLISICLSGCAAEDPRVVEAESPRVVELATVLAAEGGTGVPPDRYISCGAKALSDTPPEKVDAALEASDAPGRWAILGSDALDSYVKACRETDLRITRDSPHKP